MARIELEGVAHAYRRRPRRDEDYVLAPLNLEWKDGSACAILGPRGCGKTTLLEIVSGLLRPSRGRVLFDGRDVTGLAPQGRNVAQVFQTPVVYESMTVGDNLAFPLRNRGLPEDGSRKRVGMVAELLALSGELDRRAGALDDDAKQRVALGRGLVREDVAAILLDEPLGAIDPHQRAALRRTLRQAQRELRLTMVYATPDPAEAFSLADRIFVMADGRILQSGTAEELFEEPGHPFVGQLVGSPGMNFLRVTLAQGAPFVAGQPLAGEATGQLARWLAAQQATRPQAALVLGIRPEYVRIAADGDAGTVDAVIERVQDLGDAMLVTTRVGEVPVRLRAPVRTDREAALAMAGAAAKGQPLRICVINSHSRFYRDEELVS